MTPQKARVGDDVVRMTPAKVPALHGPSPAPPKSKLSPSRRLVASAVGAIGNGIAGVAGGLVSRATGDEWLNDPTMKVRMRPIVSFR